MWPHIHQQEALKCPPLLQTLPKQALVAFIFNMTNLHASFSRYALV